MSLVASTERVTVIHDGLDRLIAGSTVAAAVLALGAIVVAVVLSRRADEKLRKERKTEFELATLSRIAELRGAGHGNTKSSAGALLLYALPDEDFAGLRKLLADPTYGYKDADFGAEYRAAVDRRLKP
jgi:hypothetical protein